MKYSQIFKIKSSFQDYLQKQSGGYVLSHGDLRTIVQNVRSLSRDSGDSKTDIIEPGLVILRQYFAHELGMDSSAAYDSVMGAALDRGYLENRNMDDPELNAIATISAHKVPLNSSDESRGDFPALINKDWESKGRRL